MISSSEIFTAHTHYVLTSSLPIGKDGVEGVCVRVCICKGWVGMGWGSVDHHVTCVTHRLPLSPMPSNVYIASVILVYTIHKVCEKLTVFIRSPFILHSCRFSPPSVPSPSLIVSYHPWTQGGGIELHSHRSLWNARVDRLSELMLVCAFLVWRRLSGACVPCSVPRGAWQVLGLNLFT